MKQIISLAVYLLVATTTLWAQSIRADELPQIQDFTVEAKQSKAQGVPILVIFTSQGCPYCIQALQDFLLPMQRDHLYDNKVMLREIDISNRDKLIDFDGKETTPIKFANKHKIFAVPTVIFLDSNGKVLQTLVGLMTVDYYLAYLDTAIDESIAKIKASGK